MELYRVKAMATEQIPITPHLVTWARERAGVTIEEATQTFTRIAEWERGESFPTYPQLELLSDSFKLPIAVFFFPEPPDVPPIQETFRTLPAVEFSSLPSRVRLLLRKAKALQLNLSEMTQGRNPTPRLITRNLAYESDVAIDRMAAEVRDFIGVTLEQQAAWIDDDEAFKNWRRALFDVGIFVFKDAFRDEELSGFCLYDEIFPIIYVNNTCADTRQIFTLFHELAHLLFHTSGIDTLHDAFLPRLAGEAHRIEVLCNSFAAQFLVPEESLAAAMEGREISEALTENLAARFHVSREVIFRKFLDRGLVSREQYEEASIRWAGQRQRGRPGGNYYWTKLAYLGREYVSIALSQYHKNRIDETQLAEYLDTKAKNVASLEEYFERGNM